MRAIVAKWVERPRCKGSSVVRGENKRPGAGGLFPFKQGLAFLHRHAGVKTMVSDLHRHAGVKTMVSDHRGRKIRHILHDSISHLWSKKYAIFCMTPISHPWSKKYAIFCMTPISICGQKIRYILHDTISHSWSKNTLYFA
jgi:hypothetical protein